MIRSVHTVIFAALALAAPGCGSGGGDDVADQDGAIGCVDDPRSETYAAGLEHTGSNELFTFVLESADPAPPAKGNNDWMVQILDADSNPVTGATFTVTPFMPDHGHGTSVTPQTSEGTGDYTISPLYLFMPGLWEVTIRVDSGSDTDTTKYDFCIQG